ncbi:MAG: alpha/beta fold hydrolase [Arenibacterium sp.]
MTEARTREQVVAAIYDAALKPGTYDTFMDHWAETLAHALENLETLKSSETEAGHLRDDPELEAHFERAFDILERFGRNSSTTTPTRPIVDNAVFALRINAQGKIVSSSEKARKTLGSSPELSDLLLHLNSQSVTQLKTMIAGLGQRPSNDAGVILTSDLDAGYLLARADTVDPAGDSNGATLTLEALEIPWSTEIATTLTSSFGFSKAEMAVIREMTRGNVAKEIAENLNKSEHTVRNHIKSVLSKSGAAGQVDLMRLVSILSGSKTVKRSGNNTNEPANTPREQLMTLSGGKTMQVVYFGREGGFPVLFFHGMLDALTALRMNERQIHNSGLRFIAPMRPGFGHSTASDTPANVLPEFLRNVTELLDAEGIQQAIVMGHMAGSVYAHALARRLPSRVAAVFNVSGAVPITRLSQFSHMARRQRTVAYTARFAERLLPTILRAGISQIDNKQISDFMDALFQPGTYDNKLISRLGVIDTMRQEYRLSVLQGHKGFQADSHYVVRDWSDHVAPPSVPCTHYHGALDPVVSPQSVEAFAEHYPHVDLTMYPDKGQLILYEQARRIFDDLNDAIDGLAENRVYAAS